MAVLLAVENHGSVPCGSSPMPYATKGPDGSWDVL
jgi:hypothetical protein